MLPKSISKLMLFLSGKKVKINIIYIKSQIIDDIAVIIIKEIVLYTTAKCNLNCRYCFISKN